MPNTDCNDIDPHIRGSTTFSALSKKLTPNLSFLILYYYRSLLVKISSSLTSFQLLHKDLSRCFFFASSPCKMSFDISMYVTYF